MAETATDYSTFLQNYIKGYLDRGTKGADAAQAAGYPPESNYTKTYYQGVPYLYMYGDADQKQALQRMGSLYNAYGQAGGYDKTNFADIGQMYQNAGSYDPTQYELADYTAQNIQQRMNPYEELVANQQRQRLKKAYDEGRGEREGAAIRSNAFGGSGAAIQEELARRSYLEQMADMDAQSLSNAFESGAGLYSKEIADRMAAMQNTEASRQFGKNTQMAGLEGLMGARQQEAAQNAAAKESQFTALQGQGTAAQQQAAMAEQQKNMQLANLAAMQSAGQQKEERALAQAQYPLGIASLQANLVSPLAGGASQIPMTTSKTSTTQNILGGLTAGAGIISGIGDLFGAAGGLVPNGLAYNGGGLASIEPEYYDLYER